MMGLTPAQAELLAYLRDVITETGVAPSFEDMRQHVGLRSKSGIYRLITALEERRHICRLPGRARAIQLITDVDADMRSWADGYSKGHSAGWQACLQAMAQGYQPGAEISAETEEPRHG